jgi:PleD family two-component response regulator
MMLHQPVRLFPEREKSLGRQCFKFTNETEIGRYVTLSISVATYRLPQSGTANALIETSDQALYKAKEN